MSLGDSMRQIVSRVFCESDSVTRASLLNPLKVFSFEQLADFDLLALLERAM